MANYYYDHLRKEGKEFDATTWNGMDNQLSQEGSVLWQIPGVVNMGTTIHQARKLERARLGDMAIS